MLFVLLFLGSVASVLGSGDGHYNLFNSGSYIPHQKTQQSVPLSSTEEPYRGKKHYDDASTHSFFNDSRKKETNKPLIEKRSSKNPECSADPYDGDSDEDPKYSNPNLESTSSKRKHTSRKPKHTSGNREKWRPTKEKEDMTNPNQKDGKGQQHRKKHWEKKEEIF